MTSGLENASFSLPEWQAVKMIFFAPCEVKIYSCFQVILMLVVYGNEFTTKTHTKLLLIHTKIKDKIEPYRMILITIIHSYYNNKFSAYFLLSIKKCGRIIILTLYTSKDFSTNACKLQENLHYINSYDQH